MDLYRGIKWWFPGGGSIAVFISAALLFFSPPVFGVETATGTGIESATGATTAKPGGAAPVPSEKLIAQAKLASELYDEMARTETWNVEVFKKNHRRVIDECPDTKWAIESCWRLSNLLLTGQHDPDREEAVRLMEHALERYPANNWEERFATRLINLLMEMQDYPKLRQFCEKRLTKTDLSDEKRVVLNLRAGVASENLKDRKAAIDFFQQVIALDGNQGSVSVRAAKKHLDRLAQTKE